MTKEKIKEAIAVLKRTVSYDSEFADAKEVAIEAIEYLEKNKKWIDLLNIFAESCDFDVNKIMWKAQEWIPCSERLPEVGEICLLTVYDSDWYYKEDTRVIIGRYSDNYANHILAWMPLPEPYKERK